VTCPVRSLQPTWSKTGKLWSSKQTQVPSALNTAVWLAPCSHTLTHLPRDVSFQEAGPLIEACFSLEDTENCERTWGTLQDTPTSPWCISRHSEMIAFLQCSHKHAISAAVNTSPGTRPIYEHHLVQVLGKTASQLSDRTLNKGYQIRCCEKKHALKLKELLPCHLSHFTLLLWHPLNNSCSSRTFQQLQFFIQGTLSLFITSRKECMKFYQHGLLLHNLIDEIWNM